MQKADECWNALPFEGRYNSCTTAVLLLMSCAVGVRSSKYIALVLMSERKIPA